MSHADRISSSRPSIRKRSSIATAALYNNSAKLSNFDKNEQDNELEVLLTNVR